MADYNIYLRAMTVVGGANESPTKPWSRPEKSENIIGDGTSPANTVVQVASFVQSPDSLISTVLRSGIGALGVSLGAGYLAKRIADNVATKYLSYTSASTGQFKTAIAYDNFKAQIHNIFHPFQNWWQVEMNKIQIRNENLATEQHRLLTGGSVITNQYGRYL